MIAIRSALTIVLLGLVMLCLGREDSTFVQVFRTDQTIKIDGILDEIAWDHAVPAPEFWQWFPSDTTHAMARTEIRMLKDEHTLYVSAICHTKGSDYIIPSLRRDFQAGGNDNITLMFDPFNDGSNAFLFGLNPYGVKREAIVTGSGGRDAFNFAWDNKWEGEATKHDGYYVCEFAIPFSTLRYRAGSQQWSFNSYRFDTQVNEWSTLHHVPRNQFFSGLGFMIPMFWEEPIESAGKNMSIIPYVNSGIGKDFEEQTKTDIDFDLGGDVKIAVNSGLNLDLTVNPDYSQVEVDEQVTNLTRFELFFPERRQFFIENSDLFGSFGSSRINPFFSRRIGIARDTTTDINIQNTIYGGARLSGKLTDDVRLGILNMQTARDLDNGIPSFNYSVAALQKQTKGRSNLGAIFVNKQHFSNKYNSEINKYNRVFGLDYNLRSENNIWEGKAFYHRSLSPDQEANAFSQGARLKFNHRNVEIEWSHSWVGEGYNAEVGFVPRTGYFSIHPEIQFVFYPKQSKSIITHGPGLELFSLWKPDFGRSDEELSVYWGFSFSRNQRLRIYLTRSYTYLFDPFDPTRTDSQELPANSDYINYQMAYSYSSDSRKKLSIRSRGSFGEFFNGKLFQVSGTATYRYQPLGSVAMNFSVSNVSLPAPYAKATLLLLGPRVDFTFSKKVFLTTFIQYNNQVDNLNINARIQWRYKPVSDLYLVFTDNYTTDRYLSVRNRAIVAKVTYWLNT